MRKAMNSISPWSLSAEIDAAYPPTPMLLDGVNATMSAVTPAPSTGRAIGFAGGHDRIGVVGGVLVAHHHVARSTVGAGAVGDADLPEAGVAGEAGEVPAASARSTKRRSWLNHPLDPMAAG